MALPLTTDAWSVLNHWLRPLFTCLGSRHLIARGLYTLCQPAAVEYATCGDAYAAKMARCTALP